MAALLIIRTATHQSPSTLTPFQTSKIPSSCQSPSSFSSNLVKPKLKNCQTNMMASSSPASSVGSHNCGDDVSTAETVAIVAPPPPSPPSPVLAPPPPSPSPAPRQPTQIVSPTKPLLWCNICCERSHMLKDCPFNDLLSLSSDDMCEDKTHSDVFPDSDDMCEEFPCEDKRCGVCGRAGHIGYMCPKNTNPGSDDSLSISNLKSISFDEPMDDAEEETVEEDSEDDEEESDDDTMETEQEDDDDVHSVIVISSDDED